MSSDRFDTKFFPDPNSGCWLWEGAVDSFGYGQFWHEGKMVGAHRFSFEKKTGVAPGDMLVLHKCHNPHCVNPGHLYLGTNRQNAGDKVRAGRQAKGVGHGCAKLTEAEVLEILSTGGTNKVIAKQFGVSGSLVGQIKSKKRWTHLHGEPTR
jgi:hypothetical protein